MPGLVWFTSGQSQVLGWVIVGPGFPDLVTAYWWMWPVPDTAGCGFQGVPKLVLAIGERGKIPEKGPGCLRAAVDLLVGGLVLSSS